MARQDSRDINSLKNTRQEITELELVLGIPEGLFYRLRDEDDWSFIIKVQALLELALAYLIQSELGRPELAKFLEQLSLNGKSSKLTIIKALGLLDQSHYSYLKLLADLRNKVAHNIKYVGFNLSEYLKDKSDPQLREFVMTAACLPSDTELKLTKKDRMVLLAKPRTYLWYGAMDCLVVVYLKDQLAEQARQRTALVNSLFAAENLGFTRRGGLHQLALANALRNYQAPGLLGPAGYTPTEQPTQ